MLKGGLAVGLGAVAAEALIVGAVAGVSAYRRSRSGGPPEGAKIPWERYPEVELDSSGERLKTFQEYTELYEEMFKEIERAEDYIFIETFIWQDDEVGRRFLDTLARKAREGVRVYAIFDGLANLGQPESFKRFPDEINTLHYRPFPSKLSFLNPRNYVRDHRKILVVDGRVAFTGGFNLGNLYTRWRDTHVRVTGGQVYELAQVFVDFWNMHRADDLPEIAAIEERDWDPTISIQRNDPAVNVFTIRDRYLQNLNRAKDRVYLTTPYLILGGIFRRALANAVERGADVQVMIPENSNHPVVDWLARSHFEQLLRDGVRIFTYKHFMYHPKTITIDGVWSMVGTANADTFSLLGLYEVNLEIYSDRYASQLESIFEVDKTNAEEITLEGWRNRPLPEKLVEKALTPLSIVG